MLDVVCREAESVCSTNAISFSEKRRSGGSLPCWTILPRPIPPEPDAIAQEEALVGTVGGFPVAESTRRRSGSTRITT